MYRAIFVLLALSCFPLVSRAADRAELSARARVAMEKHDRAEERARQAYERALLDAKRIAIKELEIARNVATRENRLPEAQAIDALIGELQEEIARLSGGEITSLTIEALIDGASELWITRTGIQWKSHGNVVKPGLDGGPWPTLVNGDNMDAEMARPASEGG